MRVKPLQYWMETYDLAAKKRGWSLFDAEGTIAIQRIDEPAEAHAELADDEAAISDVIGLASKGAPLGLLALYLDGREVVSPDEEAIYLPPDLR